MAMTYEELLDLYGSERLNLMKHSRDIFFCIPAVPSITEPAWRLAKDMGTLNKSIRKGDGNWVGKIFEVAWFRLFGGEWVDEYDLDFIMPKNWLRRLPQYYGKFDLKAKERADELFMPNWEVSVADKAGLGINQKTDIYPFASVSVNDKDEPTDIWFLGMMWKNIYLKGLSQEPQDPNELDNRGRKVRRFGRLKNGAEFRKKGVPYDFNGFECREDCWNRKACDLEPFKISDLNNPRSRIEIKKIMDEARDLGRTAPQDVLMGQTVFIDL